MTGNQEFDKMMAEIRGEKTEDAEQAFSFPTSTEEMDRKELDFSDILGSLLQGISQRAENPNEAEEEVNAPTFFEEDSSQPSQKVQDFFEALGNSSESEDVHVDHETPLNPMQQIFGTLLQAKAVLPLETPEEQYDQHTEITNIMQNLWNAELWDHVDVRMILVQAFPDTMIYREADELVESFTEFQDMQDE